MDRSRRRLLLQLGILAASCAPQTVVLNDVADSGVRDAAVPQDLPADAPQADAPNGKDVVWPPFPDASCFPRSTTLHPQPAAQVLIELDRSTAMQATFSNYTRIAAVQSALTEKVANYQKSVQFGYEEFPSTEGGPPGGQCSGCCAGLVSIQPTLNDWGWMNIGINCLDTHSNCKGASPDSPSHSALQVASDFFNNMFRMRQSDADQYVLLFTSSEPSCSGQEAASVCQSARNAISGLANNRVQVYVFSVGYAPDKAGCLSDLTKAGSTTTLVTVNDFADLSSRLDGILHTAAASACTMTLDGPPPGSKLDIYLGPTLVPSDGWTYTPGARNAITLNGTYCNQYLAPTMNDKVVASYSTCAE
jgi:hypothetical protein